MTISTDNEYDDARAALFVRSEPMPQDAVRIEGIDFNYFRGQSITVEDMVAGMTSMGFQASSMGEAAKIIEQMRTSRDPDTGQETTILLGYTSNLISSGLRETFRWLVEHKQVSAIVTTAGGIEEDFIKCLGNTYLGSFTTPGTTLRAKGLNRIGNMIAPNDNYCAFEQWIQPILDTLLDEQEASDGRDASDRFYWTPSKLIHRLGKEINDERSVYYWAWKNDIPIFCPALTDGSIGDMLHFHKLRSAPRQLRIDIVEDVSKIDTLVIQARRVGTIILGGGLVKHHIMNACLMRNGADHAVYINTAQEFDGSDAGARPDEAISWGKIRADAQTVKVYAEATVVFPLLVAATFAKPEKHANGVNGASARQQTAERSRERYKEQMDRLVGMATGQDGGHGNGHEKSGMVTHSGNT